MNKFSGRDKEYSNNSVHGLAQCSMVFNSGCIIEIQIITVKLA